MLREIVGAMKYNTELSVCFSIICYSRSFAEMNALTSVLKLESDVKNRVTD